MIIISSTKLSAVRYISPLMLLKILTFLCRFKNCHESIKLSNISFIYLAEILYSSYSFFFSLSLDI